MARLIRAITVFAVGMAVATAQPAAGLQGAGQDTLRPPTPEEYQAMRRQWMEARRAGFLVPPPMTYGSAVVGAASPGSVVAGRVIPGRASGVSGPVQVLCDGWPAGPATGVRAGGPGTPEVPDRRSQGRPGVADAITPAAGGLPCQSMAGPSGYGPQGPGYGPYSAYGPTYPGYGPTYPGQTGAQPGYGPTYPGYGPTQPGYGPTYPGYGPTYPGYGPTYPGVGPGVNGYGSRSGSPFEPPVPGWGGWAGVGQFYWTPWGPAPVFPYGWRASPGAAYGFAWPGMMEGECAHVAITAAGGTRYEITVGLQTFGLADISDLDLAIDARLSSGEAVTLTGIDGRILRLVPGPGIEDIRVTRCGP